MRQVAPNWTGKILRPDHCRAFGHSSNHRKLRRSPGTYALNCKLNANFKLKSLELLNFHIENASYRNASYWIASYRSAESAVQPRRSMIGGAQFLKNCSNDPTIRSWAARVTYERVQEYSFRKYFHFSKVQYKLILEFDFKRMDEIDLNMPSEWWKLNFDFILPLL